MHNTANLESIAVPIQKQQVNNTIVLIWTFQEYNAKNNFFYLILQQYLRKRIVSLNPNQLYRLMFPP